MRFGEKKGMGNVTDNGMPLGALPPSPVGLVACEKAGFHRFSRHFRLVRVQRLSLNMRKTRGKRKNHPIRHPIRAITRPNTSRIDGSIGMYASGVVWRCGCGGGCGVLPVPCIPLDEKQNRPQTSHYLKSLLTCCNVTAYHA